MVILAGTPPDWRYCQINSIIIDYREQSVLIEWVVTVGLRIQVYVQAGARTQVQMPYILACVQEWDILVGVQERGISWRVCKSRISWRVCRGGISWRVCKSGIPCRVCKSGISGISGGCAATRYFGGCAGVCVLTWKLILDFSVPC